MDAERYADTAFGRPRRTGGVHGYVAYVPKPIPRDLALSGGVVRALADAESALGRLAGAGRLLTHPHVLVGPYLRREAVSSARIEGTQASLADVFEAEADERPLSADLEEVVNYLRAMNAGLERLATLPLSVRLIREMHGVVLAGVRGRERQPGELRTSQNWIGRPGATLQEAAFVPPPPEEMGPLLTDWERFVHDGSDLSPLVEAALLHYQFETIHPFLDGNGRLGRLSSSSSSSCCATVCRTRCSTCRPTSKPGGTSTTTASRRCGSAATSRGGSPSSSVGWRCSRPTRSTGPSV